MGCFVGKQDFFRCFFSSFGTYKGEPHFFFNSGNSYPSFLTGTIPRNAALWRISCVNLLDKPTSYVQSVYDDPSASYVLSRYGYARLNDSVVFYQVGDQSSGRGTQIGHSLLYRSWSSDNRRAHGYDDVSSNLCAAGLAKTLAKRFETKKELDLWPSTGIPAILNENYLLVPTGTGEVCFVHYRTNNIGFFDRSNNSLRIFKGPAAEIHRKKIKDLLKNADIGEIS